MRTTVLHLIDTGGPGGAETIFLELVDRLDRRRYRSIAVVPSKDWLHAALSARGIEPVLLPTRRAFDAAYLTRLLVLARQQQAGLIQTHLLTTGVYGSAVGRLAGIPVVSTFHGQVDIAPTDRFRRIKLRVMDRATNRLVFVSESLRRSVLALEDVRPELTRVVANGIDMQTYRAQPDRSLRTELGIPEDAILVGAVGNVRRSKDYANLLRAAAWLRARSGAYHFVIAGDTRAGALYDDLLSLRTELGLDDFVTFIGFREDSARVLNNCDVYVLSSDREGFSLTTVQAMACGVPVVATRCGGPEEIITDGVNGVLVDARDPIALGRGIEMVVSDPVLRSRMVASARPTAEERFGMHAMIRGYETIYEELLGTPARVPHRVPHTAGLDATARPA